ncbi:MAG: hypothetical protein V4608_11045 [Bacteroidota bacterium]
MSICNPCTRLMPVALCTDSIVIGTVATINTVYNIYFTSLATGKVFRFNATSSGAGLLTLTPTDGFDFASDTGYELKVNKVNTSLTGENLTIGGTTAKCFFITFEHVPYSFVSQTLELEA